MKKLFSLSSVVALAFVFTATAHANIRVFNNSFNNQAGQSQDIYLDTWDYLANPAYYSRLKNSAFSMGVTNEGQLSGTNNTIMFGAKADIGLPLYFIGSTYNNSSLIQDNDGSKVGSTNDAVTKANQQNYQHRLAVGTDLGALGLQLFMDLNSRQGANFTNATYDYSDSNATGATLKSETWNSRTQESPNRFGLNVGGEANGLVWQAGAAFVQRGGSEYDAKSADGTQTANVKNGLTVAGGSIAFSGLAANALAGYQSPLVASSAVGKGGTTRSAVNNANGLEFNALVYLPASLINNNDRLGIGVSYSASTAFGQGDFEASFKNAATATDMTIKVAHESNGIGTINAGVNYATTFGDVNKAAFTLIPTINFNIDNGGTTYTPSATGKFGGANLTTPANGSIDSTLGLAGGYTYVGGAFKSYQVTDTALTLSVSLPMIFNYQVNSVFNVIAGTVPTLNIIQSNEKNVVSTAADAAGTKTETNSRDNNNFGTSVVYALGAQIKPIENFRINLMAAAAGGRSDIATVAISADYLFGATSSNNSSEE